MDDTTTLPKALARTATCEIVDMLDHYKSINEIPPFLEIIDRDVMEWKISKIVKDHVTERRPGNYKKPSGI